jgi:uncharacterized protein (DUF2252 family)
MAEHVRGQSAAEIIVDFNHGREPERLAMKYRAMRTNAFVFLRGTAHLYHRRYTDAGLDRTAPLAWSCNDLHLENFGTYLADNGLSYFDINDFDEAALAHADWDIIRLVTSLLVAAKPLEIGRGPATSLAKIMIETYAREMIAGKPRWLERKTADGPIGDLIDGLRKRDDVAFLDRRTVFKKGARRLDIDGKRTLPVDKKQRQALEAFFQTIPTDTLPKTYFQVLDAARRVAGTGSLGLDRYAVLAEGEGSPNRNILFDLKAAAPSAVVEFLGTPQPAWRSDAERVVTLQSRCQAVTPAFLRSVTFDKKPFLLKMLQPTADRLELARLAKDEPAMTRAVGSMAALAAWAQLRSSGRQKSAPADDLIAMAGATGFKASVLERARVMANTAEADFDAYATAFDTGLPTE